MKRYSRYIPYFIIFILLVLIIKLIILNKDLVNSLPYFIKGEKIEYFDLINMNGKNVNDQLLLGDKPSLIFVFSRPCSPCNKNIIYWKNMAEIFKGKVNIYGVILNSATEAFNLKEKSKVDFHLFIPENINKFIKHFRIKLNLAETNIYKDGVKYTSIGDLSGEEAVKIINIVKGILKWKK